MKPLQKQDALSMYSQPRMHGGPSPVAHSKLLTGDQSWAVEFYQLKFVSYVGLGSKKNRFKTVSYGGNSSAYWSSCPHLFLQLTS